MQQRVITAVQMARAAGISPKPFRAALRKANLTWHPHGAPLDGLGRKPGDRGHDARAEDTATDGGIERAGTFSK